MRVTLNEHEVVVKCGIASTQAVRGSVPIESGQLVLTNQRLVFEKHRSHGGSATREICLSSIGGVNKTWTRFGPIPVMPNSLMIQNDGGAQFHFVLAGRNQWISAINEQREKIGRSGIRKSG